MNLIWTNTSEFLSQLSDALIKPPDIISYTHGNIGVTCNFNDGYDCSAYALTLFSCTYALYFQPRCAHSFAQLKIRTQQIRIRTLYTPCVGVFITFMKYTQILVVIGEFPNSQLIARTHIQHDHNDWYILVITGTTWLYDGHKTYLFLSP